MGSGASSFTSVEEVTSLDESRKREESDALFDKLDVIGRRFSDARLNVCRVPSNTSIMLCVCVCVDSEWAAESP